MNRIIYISSLIFLVGVAFGQHAAVINTKRDAPIGTVSFGPAAISGLMGSDNFIDGYIRKSGNNSFVFPVGDEGFLRPFATSADEITGAYFGVDPKYAVTSNPMGGDFGVLPLGGPFNTNLFGAGIKKVSSKEYWDINGNNATKITLSWNANSDVTSLAEGKGLTKLTIVGWDGSKWVKIASKPDQESILGGNSDLTSGSITTDEAFAPDTYNVYSLGALLDGALPVTLVIFRLVTAEQAIRLDWATSTEINSSHFDIERSRNGKSWSTLGSVQTKSADESESTLLKYDFMDNAPWAGHNYYRLKMVDKDETFAYSDIRYAKFGADGEMLVYPNPVSQRLFLTGFSQNTIREARMIDASGKSTPSPKSFLQEGMDVSKMQSGTYILNLTLNDGESKSYTVLVKP